MEWNELLLIVLLMVSTETNNPNLGQKMTVDCRIIYYVHLTLHSNTMTKQCLKEVDRFTMWSHFDNFGQESLSTLCTAAPIWQILGEGVSARALPVFMAATGQASKLTGRVQDIIKPCDRTKTPHRVHFILVKYIVQSCL